MLIFADILSSTILFAVPLLLVALGGMFSERSGIINIALEGIMIIGALLSCLFLRAMDQIGWGAQHPQFTVFLAILVAAALGRGVLACCWRLPPYTSRRTRPSAARR